MQFNFDILFILFYISHNIFFLADGYMSWGYLSWGVFVWGVYVLGVFVMDGICHGGFVRGVYVLEPLNNYQWFALSNNLLTSMEHWITKRDT